MEVLNEMYQDVSIQFLLNPMDKNVMINATGLAKSFNRRTKDFLKSANTKSFIQALKSERAPNGARSDHQIMDNRGHVGIYFCEELALKFAAWLDPHFEVWVYDMIKEHTFGNYRRHWNAQIQIQEAKDEMKRLKPIIMENPTAADVRAYFLADDRVKQGTKDKKQYMSNQLQLFK